jgi:hypothetical protein
MLTKNILKTQIKVGVLRNCHWSLTNINPKCDICVNANAELSMIDAFLSPIDFAKLECTIPLKNNSSPIGLNVMPVKVIMANKIALSFELIPFGILYCERVMFHLYVDV